ncbi:hypothetical protein [Nonomuraea roseoviolacea]|uniref:Integrase n=1 Tax=Nonomuraea roseoviolacea subsp. carminata TaxID=160689 RepID=A0ABT1K0U3_9ACTN|nr:hypothetical protein [Nonomuraea roseoviolacea]MCP2347621.1 hypothetical protein [Nonomuraea roseoviolacea subsp. carminata]
MGTRLRTLSTGGREFVWTADIRHVSGSGDCHRCVRLRVWGSGKNGRALQADLLSNGLAPWGCATDNSYPLPSDVRAVIERGLAAGWDPDARGGTFLLTEREHAPDWELPGFLLTDRLQDPEAPDPTERVVRASNSGEATRRRSDGRPPP